MIPHSPSALSLAASRVRLSRLARACLLGMTTVTAAIAGCDDGRSTEDAEEVGVVTQGLSSGFRLPFRCGYATTVTQGNNTGFSHNGVSAYGFDFGVPLNTQLVAAKGGVVTYARNDVQPGNPCYSGGGPSCASTLNYVTVAHGDGTSTVYAHLNKVLVSVGQQVKQGQPVGLSGGTGYSTGPHTHLQRQVSNCGFFYCQSVPMSFDDVVGAGVPVGGQAVKSQNTCSANPDDCPLGDADYCGNNGVKGDPNSLYTCTDGVPKLTEKCTYGCKAGPNGTVDRCATASEAPPVDAGTDAQAEVEASTPAPPSPSTPSTGAPPPAASMEPEAPAAVADSGCSVTPSRGGAPPVLPVVGVAAALALLARRRRSRGHT